MERSFVSRRALLGILGMAGGALLAAGCRLRGPALPARTFLLQPASRERNTAAHGSGVLLVRPFRTAPAFEGRAFVIRSGEAEYATDAYHGFLLSPGPMIADAVATWIRELGVFATVTTGGSQVQSTHMLEGEITALYGDYRKGESPAAVLGLQLRLVHPLSHTGNAVAWQKDFRKRIPIEQPGADELVAGWNTALSEICRELDSAPFHPNQPIPATSPARK